MGGGEWAGEGLRDPAAAATLSMDRLHIHASCHHDCWDRVGGCDVCADRHSPGTHDGHVAGAVDGVEGGHHCGEETLVLQKLWFPTVGAGQGERDKTREGDRREVGGTGTPHTTTFSCR